MKNKILILIISAVFVIGIKNNFLMAQVERKIPITTLFILTGAGYIIPHDQPRGIIFGAPNDKSMIGEGDKVYIDIGKSSAISSGDKFTIYRQLKEVTHPLTKMKMGYLIEILGELEVVEAQKKISIAKINRSFGVIEVGVKIMEFEEINIPTEDPFKEKKKKDIQGIVLAIKHEKKSAGAGDIIYIDQGLSDGVIPGDLFSVYRLNKSATEITTGKEVAMPKVVIGQIKVINTRSKTSSVIVVKNSQEILLGEKLEAE